MRITPEAVSQHYQKIYFVLNIPKMLLDVIEIFKKLENPLYSQFIRKAAFILMAFLYKNKSNQDFFYTQNLQKFSVEDADSICIFSEVMRDNKKLQKLSLIHMWAKFTADLLIMGRVTNQQNSVRLLIVRPLCPYTF